MTRWRPVALLAALLLAGCTAGSSGPAGGPASATGPVDGPDTLRVLAGSEVRDMLPILAQAKAATGVSVELAYAGTLEGAEQVASGTTDGRYDALWFSSNRYLALLPTAAGKTTQSTKVMASPVVLGLRPDVATRLGWDRTRPTWAQIADAAGRKEFTYGMTNPAASNSGFSALVGVATALAGTGDSLTQAQITAVTPQLRQFFAGQSLTAGSSGYLADRFAQNASAGSVDGLINYESVLLDLASRAADPVPLTIVYPADGVVTADYPMTLLASAAAPKRALYDKLVTWLRTPEAQRATMAQTARRPVVPGVPLESRFGSQVLVELPFPNQLSVADGLIAGYLNVIRKPAQTIFVLDTSGSMKGERIASLRQSLLNLAGADTSTAGGFARFRDRERVTLIPFSSAPAQPQVFVVPATGQAAVLGQISAVASSLKADGGTAIYDSLQSAYAVAAEQVAANPDTFTSVVLMTDGENTDGEGVGAFESAYRALPAAVQQVPTFVVLFGGGDAAELTGVATLTGGRTFDARSGDLTGAFKDIRGYQ